MAKSGVKKKLPMYPSAKIIHRDGASLETFMLNTEKAAAFSKQSLQNQREIGKSIARNFDGFQQNEVSSVRLMVTFLKKVPLEQAHHFILFSKSNKALLENGEVIHVVSIFSVYDSDKIEDFIERINIQQEHTVLTLKTNQTQNRKTYVYE